MHKYKQVHIPNNSVSEQVFTEKFHPAQYYSGMSRKDFLELINDWNRLAVLQSKVTGKITWMYIAL